MKTLRTLFVILVATLAIPAAASHAQETLIIERMVIEVWPEFDQREALVIQSGQVAEVTPLPVTLRITLPPTAEINAVAYRAPQGLLTADYTLEGDTVVMQSETGIFHIEYYDSAFAYDGQERNYTLNYTPDYPINGLIWSIQQPPDVAAIETDPVAIANDTNANGLTVVEGSTTDLTQGTPFTLTMNYTRASDALVIESLQAGQITDPSSNNARPDNNTNTNNQTDGLSDGAFVAIAIGIGVLVGAAVYVVVQGGPEAMLADFRSGTQANKRKKKPAKASGSGSFCGQCGKRLDKGDKFCRHCGAAV